MTEERMKLIRTLAWGAIAVAALASVYVYGREVNRSYPSRNFSVDASADVDTTPDVAMFSATVLTEGNQDVAALQQANSEKMNAVNAFVKDQGVKAKDLKTLDYTLVPRYTSPTCIAGTCPPASISGYTLTQTLQVKVRDLDKLGDLLAGVVKAGANTVSNVSFVLDDDTEARNAARTEAIAKARQKAESTARAAGVRLGKLITLYETSDVSPIPYGAGGDAPMEASVKANAPAVEPGTQNTKVSVTLTYELQP